MKEINFLKSDRILVLAPHPDDESIGCGGLLLQHPNQCDVVVLTDGRYGGLSSQNEEETILVRKKEFEDAMNYAKVKKWTFLNLEDGKLGEHPEAFENLDINKYDIVFCPHEDDNHSDHIAAYKLLMESKYKGKIFTYEIWSTIAKPTHYIDISHIIEKKKHLINNYKTQIKQIDYVGKITGLNSYRGLSVYPAINYAEVYREIS